MPRNSTNPEPASRTAHPRLAFGLFQGEAAKEGVGRLRLQHDKQVLDILSGSQYSQVELYWSALHSAKYAVQYVKGDRKYIEFIQEHRARDVAYAKGHVYRKGDSLELRGSRKGMNYRPPRSAASQAGEGSTGVPTD